MISVIRGATITAMYHRTMRFIVIEGIAISFGISTVIMTIRGDMTMTGTTDVGMVKVVDGMMTGQRAGSITIVNAMMAGGVNPIQIGA